MNRITREDLMTLEAYAKTRTNFRAQVMEHKRRRRIDLGPNVTLQFEDEFTMRYQVQEMLRAERIFEERGIQDELDVYNPLVPDGRNFKATMMIEYPDPSERARWLERLIGIEDRVWLQVEGCAKVWPIADEDLDRETAEKTSSVHFLRFELEENMADRLREGAALAFGIDHPNYRADTVATEEVRDALLRDLA